MATTTGAVYPEHALFRTYELLEQILSYIDHPTLRQCRLVNSFFHRVIDQNDRLCRTWRQRLRLRQLKVLLGGAANVGKRTLITKWARLPPDMMKRYSARPHPRVIKLRQTEGENWLAEIHFFDGDAAGLDESKGLELLAQWLNGVRAVVLVYSAGSRYSFNVARAWGRRIKRRDRAPGGGIREHDRDAMQTTRQVILLGIIATKCDLPPPARVVDPGEGAALASGHGVPFWQVSSKFETANMEQPINDFWRLFRDVKMREKAEKQAREKLAAAEAVLEGHSPLRVAEGDRSELKRSVGVDAVSLMAVMKRHLIDTPAWN